MIPKKAIVLPESFHFALRLIAPVLVIGVATLLLQLLSSLLGAEIIALLYLLPIMVCTVLWGLTPGLIAGFMAFLAFNYLFLPPYYTFMVHRTQDLLTLSVFLVVAVVMSQLIGQARHGLELAHHREWEATRMYEFISAISGQHNIHTVTQFIAHHTQEAFRLERVEVYQDNPRRDESYVYALPEKSEAVRKPDLSIPMMTARTLEGEIRLWLKGELLTKEEQRLLEAFASQGALALERIRLSQGENRAQVLEESDRLKTSLLSSVSHELRSPLAAIKASVSSLRSGAVDWDNAARQDLLATIEEETDHLNLLVGNLLDMSRIEAGALKPQKKWNSIEEIAAGVVTKMRKQLKEHQLELDFHPDLPLVSSDYVMIAQVFTNLISNSVKYAPPHTAITIQGRREGEQVHIKVINQGPHVPEEHLERIFDKFYRVTAADRVTGTGLGLSICKGMIESHGGRIWAANGPRRFEFHFTLPLTLDGSTPRIPQEENGG